MDAGSLARLDRPIGTWLLLFPGWWAIALAASAWPDWRLMLLFGIGAMAMRGAGCTLNDIIDREFDAQVARTRTRPLPSRAGSCCHTEIFWPTSNRSNGASKNIEDMNDGFILCVSPR